MKDRIITGAEYKAYLLALGLPQDKLPQIADDALVHQFLADVAPDVTGLYESLRAPSSWKEVKAP
jgi:hypothetical protein